MTNEINIKLKKINDGYSVDIVCEGVSINHFLNMDWQNLKPEINRCIDKIADMLQWDKPEVAND